VDTLFVFFNGRPPLLSLPLHLQSMVGRNGLFSGYKSQRTKGQKGLEKKRLSLLCFFLKKQRRLKKKKDHELKKKKKRQNKRKKNKAKNPEKQKKDSTQSKNPRESTSQTKTTQRGVLLLPLLSSL